MHEASIMQSVFDLAFAQMPDDSMSRIDRIRLRVGVLAGVVPEALEFAFEAMKPGDTAANAKLEIERVPARWRVATATPNLSPTVPPPVRHAAIGPRKFAKGRSSIWFSLNSCGSNR